MHVFRLHRCKWVRQNDDRKDICDVSVNGEGAGSYHDEEKVDWRAPEDVESGACLWYMCVITNYYQKLHVITFS